MWLSKVDNHLRPRNHLLAICFYSFLGSHILFNFFLPILCCRINLLLTSSCFLSPHILQSSVCESINIFFSFIVGLIFCWIYIIDRSIQPHLLLILCLIYFLDDMVKAPNILLFGWQRRKNWDLGIITQIILRLMGGVIIKEANVILYYNGHSFWDRDYNVFLVFFY